MKVSVCVIVYNHERYVSRAIESVLAQKTDFEYEILIGDDCSSDKSQIIINDYAKKYPNIIPVLRPKNVGEAYNEFDLASRAKGKYISWLEGDDYWIGEDKLQRQVDFLECNRNYCAVATWSNIVDENNSILYKRSKLDEIITPFNYQKKEMPNIGSFTFKNFFINEYEKNRLSKIFFSHKMITDWTLYLFFLDHTDIMVMSPAQHCYREILSNNADNFNSIYRKRKNKYDVIVERYEYENALSNYKWNRLNINYSVLNKVSELWLFILLDRDKNSREYGKKIYKEYFSSKITKTQKMRIPFALFKLILRHLHIKIKKTIRTIKSRIGRYKEV